MAKKNTPGMRNWPPEEREKYDAAFEQARELCESTGDSVNHLKAVVLEAADNEEVWATWTLDMALREGLRQQFDTYVQRAQDKFLCDLYGDIASKPKVGGTTRRNSSGQTVHQQVFYEVMTLGQLNLALAEIGRSQHGLAVKRTHVELHAKMCHKANLALGITPDNAAWDDMTPTQAADVLDVTVENWLLNGGERAS